MDEKSLEKYVVEWQSAGQDWVAAKSLADQLKKNQKTFLDAIKNELDDGVQTEAKLSRRAQGSEKYRLYIVGLSAAQAKAAELKVRFDGLSALYEAKRSELALLRAKIEKGIFETGP